MFENIPGTAGWYYTRYPGFLNVECYMLLEHYSNQTGPFKIRKSGTGKRKRITPTLIAPLPNKDHVVLTESVQGERQITASG